MRFVGTRDGLQGRGDVPKLGLAEPAGVVLADSPDVRPGRLAEDLASPVGQAGKHDPRVLIGPIPLDEALADQPVHHSGQAAGRHHHSLRKVGHSQAPASSTSEAKQDVVCPEGKTVLLAEVGVQLLHHVVVCVKERLPGSKLHVAEARFHRQSRVVRIICACK